MCATYASIGCKSDVLGKLGAYGLERGAGFLRTLFHSQEGIRLYKGCFLNGAWKSTKNHKLSMDQAYAYRSEGRRATTLWPVCK